MGSKGEQLAEQFEQSLADFVRTVESFPEDKWQSLCGDEGWTVAATARHVGYQWEIEKELIEGTAGTKPMPSYTWDDVNKRNADHAQQYSSASKTDVLGLLREKGPPMASLVRGLSDEQLNRKTPFPLADGAAVTPQQIIEGGVLIDHINAHLKSIRAVQ
jgi:hypothetical protein